MGVLVDALSELAIMGSVLRPDVSVLLLAEMASLICRFYLSVAES